MELSRHARYSWTASSKRFVSSMDLCANGLLLRSLRYARPWIVTNSKAGWVEYTCQKYMPETWRTIVGHKIRVASAREMHEKEHPNQDKEWKRLAFLDITSRIPRDCSVNLIVIGDSEAEHEAGRHLSRYAAMT